MGVIMCYFMSWLEDAEITQLAEKSLAMSEKYCRLEEELHSWEAEKFNFIFFLKGELFVELYFEGNTRLISSIAAETLNATVSVKAT